MFRQYRPGFALLTALICAGLVTDVEASEPTDDPLDTPRLQLEIGETSGVDDADQWRTQLCNRLHQRLPGQCLDGGADDDIDTPPSVRYRARLHGDDDGLSLDVATRRDEGFDGQLIDRQLTLHDNQAIAAIDTIEALEHQIIDGRIDTDRTADHPPQWWHAMAWQAVALTGATLWYISYDDLNSEDWDYTGLYSDDPELELRPQSEKWSSFGGWRYDDNVMFLNTPLHPMAGAGYYLLGRGSNLGMLQSILVTNMTSFMWEAVVEHQEVLSLNDMIATGVGGIALGEFYHQFGQFFRRAEPTLFNQIMSWIFATPTQIHELIDGGGPMYLGERGDFGWPTETWHRFRIRPGVGASATTDSAEPRVDGEIDARAELNRLPDYRQHSEHSQWLTGPLRSEFGVRLSAGAGDIYNWGLDAELDFAGYHSQNISDNDVGTSYFVGTGLSFRHDQHRFGDWLDRYGIVHFPGLVVDASWLTGGADIRLRHALHPDFYHIDSLAYPNYRDETGLEAGRTVLENHRYYYGFGLSSMLGIEVEAGPIEAHWDWNYHWSQSTDRRDRFWDDEERFGQDLDQYLEINDSVSNHELGVMVDTPLPRLQAGVIGQHRQRTGRVDDGDQSAEERRTDRRALGVIQLDY